MPDLEQIIQDSKHVTAAAEALQNSGSRTASEVDEHSISGAESSSV